MVTVASEWLLIAYLQGIIGQPASGKTALVHRYLTQVYQAEESPEGQIYFVLLWFSFEAIVEKISMGRLPVD